jgi:D-3-phosphoglycerate dehydrogenase
MKRVLLCQDIHPEGRRVLEGRVDVVVAPDPHEEAVRSIMRDFHGVIVRTATRLSRETIEAATLLEVIGRTGAGVDNIDVDAATQRGIPVCYTPEANSSSVVEHVLALILSLAKQLAQMDRAVREGRFGVRYEYRAVDIAGKTVGVVGLGRIGSRVARQCRDALGMKVIAYDPYVQPAEKGTGPSCAKPGTDRRLVAGRSGKWGPSPFFPA